ncbi:dethiobiotin synthetase [Polaromonas sp. OV174]|uniref:dethiobiotin synthase n=1 Tax=Polaromonas sp. OV174 TaxID=1855300 RepID=UPI0008EB607A|nr:dethiobiotin synthase [Polaromonas sp. OV174]SFB68515.1 dethiobiotin synthetase [Polaromonas sp. OV174]
MTDSPRPTLSVFITGTDTGVGKTLVSTGLLHALAKHHTRVVGMKPVAAGTELINGQQANEDVVALRAAATCAVPPELDNPVLLPDPVSPHIAAARAGVQIDIAHLVACHSALAKLADSVVVEGAGGFLVPLSASETGADLAQALGLPVVLVVGLRLGCLNHALLTAEAIRARGLTLAGWVANHVDPSMLAQDDNIAFLQQALQAPLLATIPFQATPDPRALAFNLPQTWL